MDSDMNEPTGYEYEQYQIDQQIESNMRDYADVESHDILRLLHGLQNMADNDKEIPDGGAAKWYELVQKLRERADYYERGLIRHLRFEQKMTWREIAESVNANLGSRQAAYVKWKRLVAPDRPRPGAAGRGGWPAGRKRSQ